MTHLCLQGNFEILLFLDVPWSYYNCCIHIFHLITCHTFINFFNIVHRPLFTEYSWVYQNLHSSSWNKNNIMFRRQGNCVLRLLNYLCGLYLVGSCAQLGINTTLQVNGCYCLSRIWPRWEKHLYLYINNFSQSQFLSVMQDCKL